MSLDDGALAQVLWPHVGATDPKTGAPDPNPSIALKNYAKGYNAMLKAAIVAHALPGSVIAASAPPSAPIQGGAASGGKIVTLVAAVMVGIATPGALPLAVPGLTLEATAIATYLMANAIVAFAAGTIKGTSGAVAGSPGTPGPLTAGSGSGGVISGLAGGPLAQAVSAVTLQTGPKQVEFYDALVTYTMANAMVAYGPNLVIGVGTPTGQLTVGTAAGGTIS
jgi:hypothetical protein